MNICAALLGVSAGSALAQPTDRTVLKLSLEEAIRYGKAANRSVKVFKMEEDATRLDWEDAKMGMLPRVQTNAAFQRYTKVVLFDGAIGDPHAIPKPPSPNAGALALESSFNVYGGGRQKASVTDGKLRSELAGIQTKEQEAAIGLQVVLQYLDMVKYIYQERLIDDQVNRAQTRLNNITTFYKNGKVTKSDLLRAEVQVANIELNAIANRNDYQISQQRLNTLFDVDAGTQIVPVDTAALFLQDSVEVSALLNDPSGNYALRKVQHQQLLQENRIRLTQSFNRPSVSLFGGYGFNYPNTFLFPPVAQTIGVGTVGVKLTYDISSLYQNSNKVKAARLRTVALGEQQRWVADNVSQEVQALTIKYHEAAHRLRVIRKSIEQAETNLHIQTTKYANQLSLLTDLLEADNLYQETRFNYLQANIAATAIYYRLLFISGKL